MYFSHNVISGTIPKSFEQLTSLQVFLMRCNHLSGPLIDFSNLKSLKNVCELQSKCQLFLEFSIETAQRMWIRPWKMMCSIETYG